MGGCAMIGQSVINVKSGGRGRLSTLVAGIFLLFLILVLGDVVARIPMAALVGVMIMVSISTFDWKSVFGMGKIPVPDTVVMLATVAVTVYTHNLAFGVGVGVVLSALIFGWRIASKIDVRTELAPNGAKRYTLQGQLFFGTTSAFVDAFDPKNDPERIIVDFRHMHVWDHSAVTAIAKVAHKYRQLGKDVRIESLNEESRRLVDKVGLAASSGH
jgi:SulP family sulfate permease